MIVKFLIDLDDNITYPIVVSCRTTLADALALLRRRLNCLPLSTTAATGTQLCEYRLETDRDVEGPRRLVFSLQIRSSQGEPLALTQSLDQLLGKAHEHSPHTDNTASPPHPPPRAEKGATGGLASLTLTVLVEASENALRLLRILCRRLQSNPNSQSTTTAPTPTTKPRVDKNVSLLRPESGQVEPLLGQADLQEDDPNAGDDSGSSCSSSEDGSEDSEAQGRDDPAFRDTLESLPRLHFMKIDRCYRKAFTTRDARLGEVIAQECPIVSVAYPMQLVNAVRSSDKLVGQSYAKSSQFPSTINGVSDEDYSRYLSIAMTHGLAVVTGGRYQVQIALYPDLGILPHSCYPNAVFERQRDVAPYFGRVRCVLRRGLSAGSEVSVFRPHFHSTAFALLSKDRRQKLIRAWYHQGSGEEGEEEDDVCHCTRCWRWSKEPHEQGMSGAYFVVPVVEESGEETANSKKLSWGVWVPSGADAEAEKAKKEELTSAMRVRFKKLKLIDEKQADMPTTFRGGSAVAPSPAGDDGLSLSHFRLSMANQGQDAAWLQPTPTNIKAAIVYAKDLFFFVRDYTQRGVLLLDAAPSSTTTRPDEENGSSATEVQLVLHRFHWRLNLARYRLLEVLDWLLDAEEHQATEQKASRSPNGLHQGKVPFSKLLFDALLVQLEAEQLFLPDGHPLRLGSYQRWRRLVKRLPNSLVAAVQKSAAASRVMSWEGLQVLSEVKEPAWGM